MDGPDRPHARASGALAGRCRGRLVADRRASDASGARGAGGGGPRPAPMPRRASRHSPSIPVPSIGGCEPPRHRGGRGSGPSASSDPGTAWLEVRHRPVETGQLQRARHRSGLSRSGSPNSVPRVGPARIAGSAAMGGPSRSPAGAASHRVSGSNRIGGDPRRAGSPCGRSGAPVRSCRPAHGPTGRARMVNPPRPSRDNARPARPPLTDLMRSEPPQRGHLGPFGHTIGSRRARAATPLRKCGRDRTGIGCGPPVSRR